MPCFSPPYYLPTLPNTLHHFPEDCRTASTGPSGRHRQTAAEPSTPPLHLAETGRINEILTGLVEKGKSIRRIIYNFMVYEVSQAVTPFIMPPPSPFFRLYVGQSFCQSVHPCLVRLLFLTTSFRQCVSSGNQSSGYVRQLCIRSFPPPLLSFPTRNRRQPPQGSVVEVARPRRQPLHLSTLHLRTKIQNDNYRNFLFEKWSGTVTTPCRSIFSKKKLRNSTPKGLSLHLNILLGALGACWGASRSDASMLSSRRGSDLNGSSSVFFFSASFEGPQKECS